MIYYTTPISKWKALESKINNFFRKLRRLHPGLRDGKIAETLFSGGCGS
jgi:hypothetical protein